MTGTAALLTATGNVGQFDYVILYDVTAAPSASPFSAGHPLIGFWQCVSAISMASTDTFQVSWGIEPDSSVLLIMICKAQFEPCIVGGSGA